MMRGPKRTAPKRGKIQEINRLYKKPIFPIKTKYSEAPALKQDIRLNAPDDIVWNSCTITLRSPTSIEVVFLQCAQKIGEGANYKTKSITDVAMNITVDAAKTKDIIRDAAHKRAKAIDSLEIDVLRGERIKTIRDKILAKLPDAS